MVRVGVPYGHDMAEEYFERAGRHKDELSELGKNLLYLCGRNIRLLCL
jgi:hypothetical protein